MDYTSGNVHDYYVLMKPRVMSLVIFTSLVGLILSPESIHPFLAIISITCIAIGAGASGVLNMWYDADIDSIMNRTLKRPIPSGSIVRSEALTYGLVMSFGSVFLMGVLINWVSAIFLAFTIFFYAVIYTIWLKRRTTQNIVIGGAAGAFPPIIGWLSTGAPLSIEPILLFLIIFFWTPPHFWALSVYRFNDYEKVKVPMLPNVKSIADTKNQIVYYTIILILLSYTPLYSPLISYLYFAIASVLNFVLIRSAVKLKKSVEVKDQPNSEGLRFFALTIFYLFSLFSALLIDNLILL